MFLPLILVWESDILVAHAHMFFSLNYWALLLLSGVGGFAIGIVTMLQIQVVLCCFARVGVPLGGRVCFLVQATSPLTHNISGTAKACVQTVLALLYFRNPTTPSNIAGIALVLLGSMAYTYVRNQEMEAAKQAVKPASPPSQRSSPRGRP
jgi:solute carrier family 35 (GDP-fucose transporter), member C1